MFLQKSTNAYYMNPLWSSNAIMTYIWVKTRIDYWQWLIAWRLLLINEAA